MKKSGKGFFTFVLSVKDFAVKNYPWYLVPFVFVVTPCVLGCYMFLGLCLNARKKLFPRVEDAFTCLPYEEKLYLARQAWNKGFRLAQPKEKRLWIRPKHDDEGNPLGWILPQFYREITVIDVRDDIVEANIESDGNGGVYITPKSFFGNIRVGSFLLSKSLLDERELIQEFYIGGPYASVLPTEPQLTAKPS